MYLSSALLLLDVMKIKCSLISVLCNNFKTEINQLDSFVRVLRVVVSLVISFGFLMHGLQLFIFLSSGFTRMVLKILKEYLSVCCAVLCCCAEMFR